MPRRLGQHFLEKPSILERIAEAAAPERLPLLVEIGPGKGALTAHLLNRVDKVVAIEVDSYLIGYLRQRFREPIGAGRLEIVESDVLKADLTAWGPAAIVGNLPYYITSPILERVFTSPGWTRGVFLVQLEVANRVTASPGSRDYGYLSLLTQYFSQPAIALKIPPEAFNPPPEVGSALVSLKLPGANARLKISEEAAFMEFVKTCFAKKRKTLVNNLRELAAPAKVQEILAELELPAASRAEELPVAQLAALFGKLR